MLPCPRCPRCRKTLLVQDAAGTQVDVCISCEGAWFDAGELTRLLGSGVNIENTALAPVLHGKAPNDDSALPCPRCERGLEERPTAETAIPAHACPGGCGVWLDDGELKPMARAFAAQAEEKTRKSALARLKRLFTPTT